MDFKYLYVDGATSTGICDPINGNVISVESLSLSESLKKRISSWLDLYCQYDFPEYSGTQVVHLINNEGIKIAKAIQLELPNSIIVRYCTSKNWNDIVEHKYLYLEGELGIRDAIDMDVVSLNALHLSKAFKTRMLSWLEEYQDNDRPQIWGTELSFLLDKKGVEIAKYLQLELPNHVVVRYFSTMNMTNVYLWRENA